jgi:hypothetical protein
MVARPERGAGAGGASAELIHVTVIHRGLGAELSVLLAEDPARFPEFLREAERLDKSYKRWEYVRGARGIPGAGANIVGRLPPDLPYTGFEGYWAGWGEPEEAVVADEAAIGVMLLHALARLAGVEHAWNAGLDISQNPLARALLETALGQNQALGALQQLEPIFGEVLARLRARAETSPYPEVYDAFQTDIETAVETLRPSTYSDQSQQALLWELARASKNVESRDIEEGYDLPRAPVTKRHTNMATMSERERDGYHIMSEIGRLGDPLVRALLHISDWPTDSHLEYYAPIRSQR